MKCLIGNCQREAKRRGLCQACYNSVYILIDSGLLKYTLEEMEEKGMILPVYHGKYRELTNEDLVKAANIEFGDNQIPHIEALQSFLHRQRIRLTYEQRKHINETMKLKHKYEL